MTRRFIAALAAAVAIVCGSAWAPARAQFSPPAGNSCGTACWASPAGPLGSAAPTAAHVTTFSATGAVTGAGVTGLFASPPAIGGTAPSSGAFTTLSATGALSGNVTANGTTQTLAQWIAGALPSVTTTAALVALPAGQFPIVYRQGYAAAGDGGDAIYTWSSSACALAAGAGDGGSQIKPTVGTGCWIASLPGSADAALWGALPTGGADSGPALRAACAWSGAIGGTVRTRQGTYALNSLDSSGLGAIVIGTGSAGAAGAPCHISGVASTDYPDTSNANSPTLKLGNALNRPLIYIHKNTASSRLTDLTLEGNFPQQTGWAGGPGGLLYTIQIEDDATPPIDSSIRLDRVVVRGGYNGNLYVGSGRGATWIRDSWFQYSGTNTTDSAVYLNGYDGTFDNIQVGSNVGNGVTIAEGSQYQFTNGAIFLNGADALFINGGTVSYLVASGLNLQSNGCRGIVVSGTAPPAGHVAGIHAFTNITFDGNSHTNTGTCSDVLIASASTSTIDRFVNPAFLGNSSTTGTLPKYNIEVGTGALPIVLGPSFGTGTPNTLGFTNSFSSLVGVYRLQGTWTPSLAGTTTAGTIVYSQGPIGTWSRSGNDVTAHFSLQTSSLGTAAGNLVLNGLPLFNTATANDTGVCVVVPQIGWTGGAGYTALAGLIGTSSATASLFDEGSGKTGLPSPVTEFAAATKLIGTCQYHTDS